MQNYTDYANQDVSLAAESVYFQISLRSSAQMFFWKEKQNFCVIPAGIAWSK